MKNEKTKKQTIKKTAAKAESEPQKVPETAFKPVPERQRWWVAGLIGSLGVFVASAAIAVHHTIVGLELHIFRRINDWPTSLHALFTVCTIAPESLWIAVAVVAVTFLLKLYQLTWQLAAAGFGGYACTFLAKHFVARPRPGVLLADVHVRAHESDMGFPSGHTMTVTIVALILFPYLPKGWRWAVVVLIPVVSLSRIYLGVHAPLDVVGGFAAGVFVIAAMRLLPDRLKELLRFE